MHKAAYLITRFLVHLHQGTLPGRIKEEWHEYIRRRRTEWWNSHKGNKEYFTFPLQRNIKINLYFDSVLCRLIYCDNFEWRERQFLNDYLRSGDIFVDIGANIGLFTLIASSRVGDNGKVYSLEPCLKTFQQLVRNVELNRMNNVKCTQMALSDCSGQIQMNLALDGYDAWNSMALPIAGSSFSTEMVSAVTWDDFVRDHNLRGRVTLMKIDVEGWESRVLSGGTETFKRPDAPVLQVEFTDQASQSAGTSCQALYRQLEELGYQMYVYEAKSKRIIPYPMRDAYPNLNLFAIKYAGEVDNRINRQ
jgi:FkbM family methyltransferase